METFPKSLPDFVLTKAHVKLLKFSKKSIKRRESTYICNAIRSGAYRANSLEGIRVKFTEADVNFAALELRKFIRRALQENTYLSAWQTLKGIERTPDERRGDRVAWIKYILKNAERR